MADFGTELRAIGAGFSKSRPKAGTLLAATLLAILIPLQTYDEEGTGAGTTPTAVQDVPAPKAPKSTQEAPSSTETTEGPSIAPTTPSVEQPPQTTSQAPSQLPEPTTETPSTSPSAPSTTTTERPWWDIWGEQRNSRDAPNQRQTPEGR